MLLEKMIDSISIPHFHQWTDHQDRKINKEMQALSDTLDELNLIDIYREFHPKAVDYTFLSSSHGIFSTMDHNVGNKASLGTFRKIKIISKLLFFLSKIIISFIHVYATSYVFFSSYVSGISSACWSPFRNSIKVSYDSVDFIEFCLKYV